jgi:hypothetical protein
MPDIAIFWKYMDKGIEGLQYSKDHATTNNHTTMDSFIDTIHAI